MANKKIIVSSGDGKYQQINASVDENQLSASYLSINTGSFSALGNGLLQAVNGKVENLTGSANNYKLAYDPDMGKFISVASVTASLGGDLSGLSSAARVKSVANVTSGILSTANGGTGTYSFGIDNLVTTNGDGLLYTPNNLNKIVAVGEGGNIVFADTGILNFTPMTETLVYLYTGSVGAAQTGFSYTWTKPQGARYIRVICQAGGGSGHPGNNSSSSTSRYTGRGGSGGGHSDVTFNAFYLPTVCQVFAGNGGTGAGWVLTNGTSSSFGNYVYSYGGISGFSSRTLGSAGVRIGGKGFPIDGGNEGAANLRAPGGGAANTYGGAVTGIISAPTTYGPYFNSVKPFNFKSYYLNNVLTTDLFPNLLCTGGNGGTGVNGVLANGGSPAFGSGGGGAGGGSSSNIGPGGLGGNGGAGYVLIICY